MKRKFYNAKELKEQVQNIEELESYFICYTVITKNNEQISILSNEFQDDIKIYNHMTKEVGYNVMNDDIISIIPECICIDFISNEFQDIFDSSKKYLKESYKDNNDVNIQMLIMNLGGF